MSTSVRHLPLITSCIEFSDKPVTPLPAITTDLDFNTSIQSDDDTRSERGTDTSNSECDDVAEFTMNSKIPQPFGQPGQPGSGGYSVREELSSWGEELLDEFTTFVHTACDTHLDITKSYAKQSKTSVAIVCSKSKHRFPIVNKYEHFWPVLSIMKMYLKKSSEAYRKLGGRR